MFSPTHGLLDHFQQLFPQAHSFRFENFSEYQPSFQYYPGGIRRLKTEYIPVLHWKVGNERFCWAPSPKVVTYYERVMPFGSALERNRPDYSHAVEEAMEAIQASVNGAQAIKEYNSKSDPNLNKRIY